MSEDNARPPRDDLVRAVSSAPELRDETEDTGPVMSGHFAVFNRWTEIDSLFEGHFMERFAPGAFTKTFKEGRERMRVLFQHGMDPQVGDKPLGPIRELSEDDEGAYYEVPLLDAPYVREGVLPGLEAGLYGASFRFSVMKEEFDRDAKPSDDNPDGLPERTVKEARVPEFGPVTFPAYADATAGVRSLTDEFMVGRFAHDPARMRELFDEYLGRLERGRDKTSEPARAEEKGVAGAEPHSTGKGRDSGRKQTGRSGGYGRHQLKRGRRGRG